MSRRRDASLAVFVHMLMFVNNFTQLRHRAGALPGRSATFAAKSGHHPDKPVHLRPPQARPPHDSHRGASSRPSHHHGKASPIPKNRGAEQAKPRTKPGSAQLPRAPAQPTMNDEAHHRPPADHAGIVDPRGAYPKQQPCQPKSPIFQHFSAKNRRGTGPSVRLRPVSPAQSHDYETAFRTIWDPFHQSDPHSNPQSNQAVFRL